MYKDKKSTIGFEDEVEHTNVLVGGIECAQNRQNGKAKEVNLTEALWLYVPIHTHTCCMAHMEDI